MKLLLVAITASCLLCACSSEPKTPPQGFELIYNQSFSISIPKDFEITSSSGEQSSLPAHLTVASEENLITISKAAYFRDLNESCKLAANNFVHDQNEITSGPIVSGNICKITATTAGVKSVLFMSRDNQKGILYSITYKGNLPYIRKILSTLAGDPFLEELKRH
ncbi:MAG: hypothetical protein Q4E81_05265 [Succinatimonas sp.]|nr:hypothetical protein [Succinatimonas sp.]